MISSNYALWPYRPVFSVIYMIWLKSCFFRRKESLPWENIFLNFRTLTSENGNRSVFEGIDRQIPDFVNIYIQRCCTTSVISNTAYYTNWLSIVYDLKDRSLENLLVFSPKIEDLTFLTLVYLQTKGKREKWLSFALKSPFCKDKAYQG